MTCRIARKAKEGLTQRRNVKAQVMGDTAMPRLKNWRAWPVFPLAVAPFDDKGAIAPCELHLTALRNISYLIVGQNGSKMV